MVRYIYFQLQSNPYHWVQALRKEAVYQQDIETFLVGNPFAKPLFATGILRGGSNPSIIDDALTLKDYLYTIFLQPAEENSKWNHTFMCFFSLGCGRL